MPGHTKRAAAVPAAWASVQTNRRQTRPPHQPYAQARFCDGGGGPARALRCDRAHSSSARYDCDQVLLASNGGAGYRGGGDDVHRAIDVGAAVVRDPEEIGRLRCDTQAKNRSARDSGSASARSGSAPYSVHAPAFSGFRSGSSATPVPTRRLWLLPSIISEQLVVHVRWDWSVACLMPVLTPRRNVLDGCPSCNKPDPINFVGPDHPSARLCRSCGEDLGCASRFECSQGRKLQTTLKPSRTPIAQRSSLKAHFPG